MSKKKKEMAKMEQKSLSFRYFSLLFASNQEAFCLFPRPAAPSRRGETVPDSELPENWRLAKTACLFILMKN